MADCIVHYSSLDTSGDKLIQPNETTFETLVEAKKIKESLGSENHHTEQCSGIAENLEQLNLLIKENVFRKSGTGLANLGTMSTDLHGYENKETPSPICPFRLMTCWLCVFPCSNGGNAENVYRKNEALNHENETLQADNTLTVQRLAMNNQNNQFINSF
eukprot:gene949-264_t